MACQTNNLATSDNYFKFKGWHAVIYMPVMGRFYFDFHDDTGIIRDDAGEELPSATAARKEALEVVGQAVKDLTHRHSDGRIVIEVRDGDGPILKVSAVHRNNLLKE
jgi:hypothetical protein